MHKMRISTINWFFIIVLYLCLQAEICQSAETIVPKPEQSTDLQAAFMLAEILSHHPETQEAASQLYETLLTTQSIPAHLIHHPAISPAVDTQNKAIETETIVPQNSEISRFEALLTLAKIFSRKEETQKIALKIYISLLQEKPDNIELNLHLGRLYFTLNQFQAGLNVFYQAISKYPHNTELFVATAQAEIAAGHAKAAQALFLAALKLAKNKDALLIDYADGMMTWGDFYKAEKIYREALQKITSFNQDLALTNENKSKNCLKSFKSAELWLKLAWSLVSAQRYEEAEDIYKKLLCVWPDHPKIFEALIRLKVQQKEFHPALELVETLLQVEPTTSKNIQLKAEILFSQNLYRDAIAIYHTLTSDPKHAVQAQIGIGRAYEKIGLHADARAAFQAAYAADANNVAAQYYLTGTIVKEENGICLPSLTLVLRLNELANIHLQNGLIDKALQVYQEILQLDAEYFPAQIGRAEMLSILDFHSYAAEIYQTLLQVFPENSKIMLARARVYAWAKKYETAICLYDQILRINPHDPVLYREKARTALWNKQFDLATATYNQLITPPVNTLAQYLIQTSAILEKRAKVLNWNKRYRSSLPAYRELLAFNPGNEEAVFDYAQVHCSLGLCDSSQDIYKQILSLDPGHNLVKQAMQKNEQRHHLGLQSNFLYWREVGAGSFSASQIARYRLDEIIEIPLSCRSHLRVMQQEYVENPFFNYKFYPAEGQTVEADYLFNEHLNAAASVTYKNYFHKFKSTWTSHNRLLITPNDYWQILLSCNREDEIYNFFSLKQAIQSINSFITLSSQVTRYWNVSGTYQYYSYNDNNSQCHVNLQTEYQFTEDPDVLKVILQGDYRNAAHQTISLFQGTRLANIIYPYWTPNHYLDVILTLEYRHDYRNLVFCEAPQRYIDLKFTTVIDNAHNPSFEAVLEWKHEFDHHWGFEIKGLIHRGPLWRAEGAWATAYYRF